MNAPLQRLYIGVTATLLLAAIPGFHARAQSADAGSAMAFGKDSSFSILVDAGVGFTHANDAHMNKWLAKYNYPTEPHVPASLHIGIDAMPARSLMMYSIRLSTILSGHNLSSYNFMGGAYTAIVSQRKLLVVVGAGAGFHRDIITLNGQLPPDYQALAAQYGKQLSLHRAGLYLEPAIRGFWYPVTRKFWQLGFFGSAGFDMDINSSWKLGYYDNNHGEYGRFRKLKMPADQKKVSEHGLAISGGLSFRLHLL